MLLAFLIALLLLAELLHNNDLGNCAFLYADDHFLMRDGQRSFFLELVDPEAANEVSSHSHGILVVVVVLVILETVFLFL